MKKKIVFALLLAGMSFLAPNVADAQEKVAQTQQTAKALPACHDGCGTGQGPWLSYNSVCAMASNCCCPLQ